MRPPRWLAAALLMVACAGVAAQADRRRFDARPDWTGGVAAAIEDLVEDRRGFLWIASSEGLFRFDGLRARRYPLPDGAGALHDLQIDREDGLWIAHDTGLAYWDARADRIHAARCAVLAGTAVWRLAEATAGVAAVTGERLVVVAPGTECRELPVPPRPDGARIEAAQHINTSWWLALRDRGLWRWSEGDDHLTPAAPELAQVRVRWIEAARGRIFAGTHRHGVYALDRDGRILDHWARTATDPDRRLPVNGVLSFADDPARDRFFVGLWSGGLAEIGGDGRVHSRSRSNEGDATALPADTVSSLHIDADGTLLIGTSAGAALLDARRNQSLWFGRALGAQPGLASDSVRAVQVVDDAVWVGLGNGGVARIDEVGGIRAFRRDDTRADALPSDTVWDIAPGPGRWLWLATSGGLVRIDRDNGRVQRLLHTPDLPSDDVTSVVADDDGGAWLSMWSGGAARVDRDGRLLGAWRRDDGLPGDNLWRVQRDGAGRVFAASSEGLARFDATAGRWRMVEADHGPKPAEISDLGIDSDGGLWATTAAHGLVRIASGTDRARWMPLAAPLHGQPIATALALPDGRWWLATLGGLVEIDAEGRIRRRLDPGLGIEGGLPVSGTLAADRDGRLWFGNESGVGRIDPGVVQATAPTRSVQVTGVRLFNRPLAVDPALGLAAAPWADGQLRLDYDQDLLTLSFALPGAVLPGDLRFRYRMAGFSARWIETGRHEAEASWTRLPPGAHVFEVQAGTEAGWIEPPTRLAVEILPPWWLTWWARTGAVFALFGAFALWHRMRLRRLRTIAAELERKVAERTRALAAANQALAEAALHDALTGLMNRRGFVAAVAAARQLGEARTVALLDIDHFKRINDEHGHDAGDAALVAVATTLRAGLDAGETAGRWGGEEFALLLGADGSTRCERLRAAIADLPFAHGGVAIPLRVTLGLTRLDAGEALEEALRRADALLYAGKHGGRNRVVSDL